MLLVWLLLTGISACKKEDTFTTSTSAKLTLSTDTLFFDTVFSTFIGTSSPISVTKQLWVVNKNAEGVRTDIHVKGSANGSVKLNIDGQPATAMYGKEIRGNDSIVIFVQIYSNTGNNFIITDQIQFETNGNSQDVDVIAYAKDAYYHDAEEITKDTVWPNDKPHVLYHSLLVYPGVSLTLPQGTTVYSHINSTLYIQGTLKVNGTVVKPVLFTGDRMDKGGTLDIDYSEMTGQWIGIRILPGSKDNVLNFAVLKNGVIGVEADSVPVNANANLTLNQCIIGNMKAAGVVGYSSRIDMTNCLIAGCGEFSFYGALGGTYNLVHNTMVCLNLASSRQNPQFLVDNTPYDDGKGTVIKFPLSFTLVNNIIWGSLDEELLLNNNPEGNQTITASMSKNILRTKLSSLPSGNLISQADDYPQFTDIEKNDYSVKSTSPAKAAGFQINVLADLKNVSRNLASPTIGAYE